MDEIIVSPQNNLQLVLVPFAIKYLDDSLVILESASCRQVFALVAKLHDKDTLVLRLKLHLQLVWQFRLQFKESLPSPQFHHLRHGFLFSLFDDFLLLDQPFALQVLCLAHFFLPRRPGEMYSFNVVLHDVAEL